MSDEQNGHRDGLFTVKLPAGEATFDAWLIARFVANVYAYDRTIAGRCMEAAFCGETLQARTKPGKRAAQ